MAKFNFEDFIGDLNVQSIQTGLAMTAQVSRNDRMAKFLAGLSAGVVAGKFLWDRYQSRIIDRKYSIRISENDPLFMKVQEWLFDSLPYEDQHNVVVQAKTSKSGATSDYLDALLDTDEEPRRADFLSVFYDGERSLDVPVGDHWVTITVDSKSVEDVSKRNPGTSKITNQRDILIVCDTLAARDEVLSILTRESRKNFARRPRFWAAQKWGSFRNASDIPVRPAETVILREGQKERILEQLNLFLSREKTYVNLGIPWHTGLLLWGPPGSGKTSIATSIAHTLNLDIHYISLSSLEDDNALLELLGDVTPRSILLLEDIDIASAATDRDDERNGVTMSGLLNGLDGIATPHGIITIMTTNHYEKLDEALIRPGRVDLSEEIGYVDDYQVRELCQQFLGYVPEGLPVILEEHRLVASDVVEVFKQNIDDFDRAGEELVVVLLEKIFSGPKDTDVQTTRKKPKKSATA